MFNRLARIDAARLAARALAQHNDNNHTHRRPAASQRARAERLSCHWRVAAAGDRLESYWQIESVDESDAPRPSLVIRTAALAVRQRTGNAAIGRLAGGRAA
jgi:hypothetical protein